MNKFKGKAARRVMALESSVQEIQRAQEPAKMPLMTHKSEMITPEMAQEMLKRNKNNRPISFPAVERYKEKMLKGEWKLHPQGIILDPQGNILTGQKRLWAIVYAGIPQPMVVSRGCPAEVANLIDRGTSQTSRDLASRKTERKHSPYEGSIARAMLVGRAEKPDTDSISIVLMCYDKELESMVKETKGTKKTKAITMILGALLDILSGEEHTDLMYDAVKHVEEMANTLEKSMGIGVVDKCWGKGVGFTLAMENARTVVREWLASPKK